MITVFYPDYSLVYYNYHTSCIQPNPSDHTLLIGLIDDELLTGTFNVMDLDYAVIETSRPAINIGNVLNISSGFCGILSRHLSDLSPVDLNTNILLQEAYQRKIREHVSELPFFKYFL